MQACKANGLCVGSSRNNGCFHDIYNNSNKKLLNKFTYFLPPDAWECSQTERRGKRMAATNGSECPLQMPNLYCTSYDPAPKMTAKVAAAPPSATLTAHETAVLIGVISSQAGVASAVGQAALSSWIRDLPASMQVFLFCLLSRILNYNPNFNFYKSIYILSVMKQFKADVGQPRCMLHLFSNHRDRRMHAYIHV